MMSRLLKSFLSDRSGGTAIEYGLIATLVAATLVASLSAVGDNLQGIIDTVATAVESAQQ